ncbi:glycosyltransferase family 4 protein [Woeseia oceani]|uniref:glycosyltransferase family 4 protein n=1 Tax=Woeseia oceani TaxID=1548547 RepID=UPI0009F23AB2|nr:glycosyltransferase family 4 protein [Woeseia oceani]
MSTSLPASPLLCHVNLASDYRGGERQTQLLIEELAKRGYRQRLVARRNGKLAPRCSSVTGLEIVESASQPLAAAWAAHGADLLHAHEARGIYACWLAARLPRVPWLLTRRVDNPFKSSPLRDRAYRRASAVVGVSRTIAEQIQASYPGVRCTVIADAHADLASAHRTPEALRARFAGKTVVGHVGALDHAHKGQGTIIEMARLARDQHPQLHFVLVGDGRDETTFRASAAGLDNLEFTGFVDNIDDWLSVFDLFVFPSLHEGLGSTLLDAMSFGLPLVASNVGGIPDIVVDKVNGLLIEPERPEELLTAVLTLLQDDNLYASMRAANLSQADAYSPVAMADRYEALYRKLLRMR